MKYFIETSFSFFGTQEQAIKYMQLDDKIEYSFNDSSMVGTAKEINWGVYKEELPVYVDHKLINSVLLYLQERSDILKNEEFKVTDEDNLVIFDETDLNNFI